MTNSAPSYSMAAVLARMPIMRAATSSVWSSAQFLHPAFRSFNTRVVSTSFHASSVRLFTDPRQTSHLPNLHLVPQLTPTIYCREFSSDKKKDVDIGDEKKKTGIVAKFKQMFKNYWYILVPVHVATSIVWFGSFYFMCKSGVDVVAILGRPKFILLLCS